MTRKHAAEQKAKVRAIALLTTALHIAKHFCTDEGIREELQTLRSNTTGASVGLRQEEIKKYFRVLQEEDRAFHAFIAEGHDCLHLENLFATELLAGVDVDLLKGLFQPQNNVHLN